MKRDERNMEGFFADGNAVEARPTYLIGTIEAPYFQLTLVAFNIETVRRYACNVPVVKSSVSKSRIAPRLPG